MSVLALSLEHCRKKMLRTMSRWSNSNSVIIISQDTDKQPINITANPRFQRCVHTDNKRKENMTKIMINYQD